MPKSSLISKLKYLILILTCSIKLSAQTNEVKTLGFYGGQTIEISNVSVFDETIYGPEIEPLDCQPKPESSSWGPVEMPTDMPCDLEVVKSHTGLIDLFLDISGLNVVAVDSETGLRISRLFYTFSIDDLKEAENRYCNLNKPISYLSSHYGELVIRCVAVQ